MSRCFDPRMQQLLYAYELGMLDEEQAQLVELHLMDCEDCFTRLREFGAASQLLRQDPQTHEVIRDLGEETLGADQVVAPKPGLATRWLWSRLKPLSLAAAILLLILLVAKPWRLQFSPTQEAIAVENRLAVLYLRNLADPADAERISDVATNLLIVDLSQAGGIQVVSSQRLYDIVRQLRPGANRWIDSELATEVANIARASWIVTGEIAMAGDQTLLTVQLSDVVTGVVRSSYRLTVDSGVPVFSAVDSLAGLIRRDLAGSMAVPIEPDRRVSDLTTSSAAAYELYLEGEENYYRYYYPEAQEALQKALQLDSTLAMAHYYLSIIEDQGHIDAAMSHLSHATPIQQALIRSRAHIFSGNIPAAKSELRQALTFYPEDKEALYWLGTLVQSYEGNQEEALHYFKKVIELDSLHHVAYNKLAYVYAAIGACDKAAWAVDNYVRLAPQEANPHDSRGEIYASCGDLQSAIESYRQALRVKPDFSTALISLGVMYAFSGDYDRADSCFQATIIPGCCLDKSTQYLYSSVVPMLQGNFEEALRRLDRAFQVVQQDSGGVDPVGILQLKALLHAEQGDYQQALKDLQTARELIALDRPQDSVNVRPFYVSLLAEAGRLAEAEDSTAALRETVAGNERAQRALWYAAGNVELAKGNGDQAADYFERISALSEGLAPDVLIGAKLARAYLAAGESQKAVITLERQLNRYSKRRALLGTWSVKLHYYLGLAYQETGRTSDAANQYEIFLTKWRGADQGHPLLADARMRLAKLTRSS